MPPHVIPPTRRDRFPILVIVLCLCAPLGCTLFPSLGSNPSTTANRQVLNPIQAPPGAVQVAVFLLERPAEDPLLRSGVWKEVDQIGALASDARESLRANGIQMGIVGLNPPPTVQKLLGMSAEIPIDAPEYTKLMGNSYYVTPGRETQIATGIDYDLCEFDVQDADQTTHLSYEKARCMFRMKVYRLNDGWVRIELQPEIHHGDQILRTQANETDWESRSGQKIDVRYSQRFSFELNGGERALITSNSENAPTMGDRFFCRLDHGQKKQRVLVVQVIDTGKTP